VSGERVRKNGKGGGEEGEEMRHRGEGVGALPGAEEGGGRGVTRCVRGERGQSELCVCVLLFGATPVAAAAADAATAAALPPPPPPAACSLCLIFERFCVFLRIHTL
jgi:hypothetical protein